jgi:hypothetical protein
MHFLYLSLSLLLFLGTIVDPSEKRSRPTLPANLEAQAEEFPVPQGIPNMLFYLQRDPNPNTVIYQLNLTEQGTLHETEPIKVFWIRYAEKGQQKELNYIHRKFAYGLNFTKRGPEKYDFRFVSHDKIPFLLSKGKGGKFQVVATVNNQPLILNRMYVRIEGGTFWVPNVLHVDFEGVDVATGKETVKRYKP